MGVDHDPGWPPPFEYANSTCSLFKPSRPSAQALTISSVAPAPVGAPLAIDTLGDADRSLRAPARPSSTQRVEVPSKLCTKHGSTTLNNAIGFVQVAPPSRDFTRKCVPVGGSPTLSGFWNSS